VLSSGTTLHANANQECKYAKNIWDVNLKYAWCDFHPVPIESETAVAAPPSKMLPLGQEGISPSLEKSISILVTRNALQMGIFPILQSIAFVPILIPILSHSPVSCPLELVSTCCSFITREIGCFTGQMFYRKGSVSARLFLKA